MAIIGYSGTELGATNASIKDQISMGLFPADVTGSIGSIHFYVDFGLGGRTSPVFWIQSAIYSSGTSPAMLGSSEKRIFSGPAHIPAIEPDLVDGWKNFVYPSYPVLTQGEKYYIGGWGSVIDSITTNAMAMKASGPGGGFGGSGILALDSEPYNAAGGVWPEPLNETLGAFLVQVFGSILTGGGMVPVPLRTLMGYGT